MDCEKDILLCMYKEHLSQARHQETQRATISNLLIVICASLLGLIAYDKIFSYSDLFLGIFIIFIGLCGIVFTFKYYERFRLHYERSRAIRKELDNLFENINIAKLQALADSKTEKKHPILFKLRLFWLWILIFVSMSIFGIVLSIAILVN